MTDTTLNADSIADVFHKNAEEIASTLIAGFKLKFNQDVSHLSSPLHRWLDFRFRYIDPMPRALSWSNRFPRRRKALPRDAQMALKKFTSMVEAGDDINRYQGRGLTLRNDFSGANRSARTDLLWADWGIHHFHLSNEPLPEDQYYSRPADYLVFCLVGGDVVAIIDVLRHPDKEGFSNPSLMRTVASSWPDYMKSFRMTGQPVGGDRTQAEIHMLREGGVSTPVIIHGVAYHSPGMGITTASTSLQVSLAADRLHRIVRGLAKEVVNTSGDFRTPEIAALTVSPSFRLIATQRGLVVVESNTSRGFILPQPKPLEKLDDWQILHDLILPIWARTVVTENDALEKE